jgi:uncharacterized repeat protein (TIGR01451 family)
VSFREITAAKGVGTLRRNWKITSVAAGNQGDLIAQYICSNVGEKFYTAPFLQRGVFYDIQGPPTVYAGQSFWITVVVVDSGGGTKEDYCGTTSFTSTDPKAQLESANMDTFNYTWHSSKGACSGSPDNLGVHVFVNVTFDKIGMQTMVAADVMDGTIVGLATFMVVGVDVKFWKEPKMSIQASGDTVTFKVCWSNYSSASAFTFTITDAVPMGTSYIPDSANAALCGATDPITATLAYSTSTSPTPPAGNFTTVSGASSPPVGTRWLMWAVPYTGVQTTGCLCYRVTVD